LFYLVRGLMACGTTEYAASGWRYFIMWENQTPQLDRRGSKRWGAKLASSPEIRTG